MNKFESFEVVYEVATPLIPSPYPMLLDGLLYYMVACVHNLDALNDRQRITEIVDTLLCKHESGVYHASQAIYLRDDLRGINSVVIPQATNMGWEDYPHACEKRSIVYKSGRYRNRMTKNTAVTPIAVKFYGHGDIKACDYYLQQVSGLGRSHHQGHGEVTSCVLRPISSDLSLFDSQGGVHRPIPKNWAQAGFKTPLDCVLEKRNLTPPYLIGQAVDHYSPLQKVSHINS